ncbi:MAG: amidohydrolase family protein [Eubacteriales bacterium]|nr:amidohydrolase family protein [Eubacteriales bacterium]
MDDQALYERLLQDLVQAPVIDTHEHLPPLESLQEPHADVLSEYTAHYISSDLISAGLSQQQLDYVRDSSQPLEQRWLTVEPYWEACRLTGYARALDISVRQLYQLDGIHRYTILPLNLKFLENRRPGHYHDVIRDHCHIVRCINDDFQNDLARLPDQSHLFTRVWHPDRWFYRCAPYLELRTRAQAAGLNGFHTLKDFLRLLDHEWQLLARHGMEILKLSIAYERSLDFPEVSESDAEMAFRQLMEQLKQTPEESILLPDDLQNFMMHQILSRAARDHLIIQVHTGLQEGNGNLLANSNPLALNPLILRYPEIWFDLFHIGYPYVGEVCTLAKMFANVSINMCWSHIIAPVAARRALSEFLDAVPANKISAFGGDYLFPDGIPGHLQLARENVAAVLTEKVQLHILDEDQARLLGRRLFYDNPRRIFRLSLPDKIPGMPEPPVH